MIENVVVSSYGAKKRQKKDKHQHTNGTQNILLNGFTTEVVTTRSRQAGLIVANTFYTYIQIFNKMFSVHQCIIVSVFSLSFFELQLATSTFSNFHWYLVLNCFCYTSCKFVSLIAKYLA